MKLKCNGYEISRTLKGTVKLTLNVDPVSNFSALQMQNEKDYDGDLTVTINKYRKNRTIDQNSLLWSIEQKLALKLNLPTQEVHRKNICSYSQRLGQALMPLNLAEKWCVDNYAEIDHETQEKGKKLAVVNLFIGSSQLDTKEFSILVDGVIQECQQHGLNVDYENNELRSLLEKHNTTV